MKFNDIDLQNHSGSGFSVYKNPEGATIMKFSNGDWLINDEQYADLFLGKCDTCSAFFKDSFKDFTYDSVLIGGLGFGLIPQELSEINNCSKIDVVEIDQEVIDYNTSSGHLNPDINIIKGDIFFYSTTEKYDLIIIDTTWKEGDISTAQHNSLLSNLYENNLNEAGVLYIPVDREWIIK